MFTSPPSKKNFSFLQENLNLSFYDFSKILNILREGNKWHLPCTEQDKRMPLMYHLNEKSSSRKAITTWNENITLRHGSFFFSAKDLVYNQLSQKTDPCFTLNS